MRRVATVIAPTLVLMLSVALAGCGGGSPQTATAVTAAAPREGGPVGSPRTADSFVESVGVVVHTFYSGTPYEDLGTIERRLEELGVHHIRDNLALDEPVEYRALDALAARGIHSTLIVGSPENGLAGLKARLALLESRLLGSVEAIEGPNEYDISGSPDWANELAEYQRALYEEVESSPRLSSLPVVGPSLAWLRHAPEAPDLSEYLDYGNIHSYPGGEPPELNLETWLAAARYMSGPKPVMATESGYHTAINSNDVHPPVSEAAAATYIPRLFLDYFANGIVRTFAYELVDEHPDPGLVEPESDFGLLRNDLTPKPAFTALANLLSILADPGAEFTPEPFGYTVSGNREDLRQLLLEKRDGSYYLALWRSGSVWDAGSRQPIQPGSAPVEIHSARALAAASEFQPNVSASPTAALPVKAGAVTVRVGTRVVLVELKPR